MIRDLASKRLTSPSRTHLHADTKFLKGVSTKRESRPGNLNNGVVASLDALKLAFEEEDSEIEISGPFSLSSKSEAKMTAARTCWKEKHAVVQQRANDISIHPFFRPYTQHAPRHIPLKMLASPPPPAPELRLRKASSKATATGPSPASRKSGLNSNTLANSNYIVRDTPVITPPAAQYKDSLNQLPVYSYMHYKPLPTVVYTQHEEEANDLIAGLKAGPIALDIEWRVFFIRQRNAPSSILERRTAVVQVADSSGLILVIQIYSMSRFPIKLQFLLENHEVPKIGVNILNDGNKLFRDYGILAQNLVELGALALLADPAGSQKRSVSKRKITSLAKLVQWYCGMQLKKSDERISNWELKLKKQQIDYAANDVHSSMVVYERICSVTHFNSADLAKKKFMFTSNVDWPMLEKYQHWQSSDQNNNIQVHGQLLCAYQFWHYDKMSLDSMCVKLSLKKKHIHQQEDISLKPATVISYIIGALQANPSLSYSLPNLIKLVQMNAESWTHHRKWIIWAWNQNPI